MDQSCRATLLLVAAATSILAVKSGAEAHGPAERVPGAREAVQDHEELGERTRNLFLLVAALELAAIAFKQRPGWQRGFRIASGVGGIAACVHPLPGRPGRAASSSTPMPAASASGAATPPTCSASSWPGSIIRLARPVRPAITPRRPASSTSSRCSAPTIRRSPFLRAESMIRDRKDWNGALVLLAAQNARFGQQPPQHPEGPPCQ